MTSFADNADVAERLHSQLEAAVAERYRSQGFTVVVEPPVEALPFDLGTYRPDLIVSKSPNEGLIIEVKGSTKTLSVDRFREIADIASQNPGWRFLLITGDDSISETAEQTSSLLTWDQIRSRIKQSQNLIEAGDTEPAFVYLWGLLEATLRRQALQSTIPVERLSSQSLINHLYSQGELSREQFHTAKDMYVIRNQVVHGFEVSNLDEPARILHTLICELVQEWASFI